MIKTIYIEKHLCHASTLSNIKNKCYIKPINNVKELFADIDNNLYSIKELLYISDNLDTLISTISKGICSIGYDTDYKLFNPMIKNIIQDLSNLSWMYLNSILSHHNNEPAIIYDDNNLIIRELAIYDFDKIYSMFNSEPLDNSLYLSSYMTKSYTEEKEKYIEYIKTQYYFYGYGQYCILSKSTNSIIGQCGFYEDNEGNTSLSYYIEPQHRGVGNAYKVCKVLLDYISDELCISPIYAHIDTNNYISQKLISKLHFLKLNDTTYIYKSKETV